MESTSYYEPLVSAYVRGMLGRPYDVLSFQDILTLVDEHGIRKNIDKFKRKPILPRIQWVLDHLRQNTPRTLVDLGCGRGTALWPIIEQLPEITVTGVDQYEGRMIDLHRLRDHGISSIFCGYFASIDDMRAIPSSSFEVALLLEVLEHVDDPDAAARETLRITKHTVYVSVPSKPDKNPDHLRCFTEGTLRNTWLRAGAKHVRIEDLGKHFVAEVSL